MMFIAYERETRTILAIAPSQSYALQAAREHVAEGEVDSTLASDALAHALTSVGAADWYLDERGIGRLPDEVAP